MTIVKLLGIADLIGDLVQIGGFDCGFIVD
jgi:hypothetical protein